MLLFNTRQRAQTNACASVCVPTVLVDGAVVGGAGAGTIPCVVNGAVPDDVAVDGAAPFPMLWPSMEPFPVLWPLMEPFPDIGAAID